MLYKPKKKMLLNNKIETSKWHVNSFIKERMVINAISTHESHDCILELTYFSGRSVDINKIIFSLFYSSLFLIATHYEIKTPKSYINEMFCHNEGFYFNAFSIFPNMTTMNIDIHVLKN